MSATDPTFILLDKDINLASDDSVMALASLSDVVVAGSLDSLSDGKQALLADGQPQTILEPQSAIQVVVSSVSLAAS